jgi:hypothetical protein
VRDLILAVTSITDGLEDEIGKEVGVPHHGQLTMAWYAIEYQ